MPQRFGYHEVAREQLLAEVEELIRLMPERERVRDVPNGVASLGRALAVIERWHKVHAVSANYAGEYVMSQELLANAKGYNTIRTLLYRGRADLLMELGRGSVVITQGQTFEYFNEVRKVVETARSELFFVDPYWRLTSSLVICRTPIQA